MPDIVARGKKPDVLACALCHYANGKGRPPNAPLAGLPVAYFIQQMMDYKKGYRKSAEPRKPNTEKMIAFAKAMTDEEIRASAEYFGSIPYSPWIRVVETRNVPKTRIARGMYVKLEGRETEPIGNRIIEVPDNAEATALHDDHSGFTAYVPIGSIKKGEALVTTNGGGKTIQCGYCHGDNLEGLGDTPPLAGRSPSYIARQIYDFQSGARSGFSTLTVTMIQSIDKLTPEDIVAVAAYIASRPVPASTKAAPRNPSK